MREIIYALLYLASAAVLTAFPAMATIALIGVGGTTQAVEILGHLTPLRLV